MRQQICDKVRDVEVFINYDALVYSRTVGEAANLCDKVGDVEVFINYDSLIYSRTVGEVANNSHGKICQDFKMFIEN